MSTTISIPLSSSVEDDALRSPARPTAFKNVIAAVDESEQAAWGIYAALPLVRKFGGKLSLFHASAFPDGWAAGIEPCPGDLCATDPESDVVLQEASHRVPKDLLGEKIRREGDADQKIIEVVRTRNADLLVLGTHGRNLAARLLLGSTAESAVRHSPCPVLIAGHPVSDAFRDNGPTRIAIAIDDSEQARWAASLGMRLAESFNATAILIHVVPDVAEFPPTYGIAPQVTVQATVRSAGEAFLARFVLPEGEKVPIERVLSEGSSSREIVTAARENDADLIVIGTHGRRGLSRLILGSTAEAVLRHAHCPVLCVGQEQ